MFGSYNVDEHIKLDRSLRLALTAGKHTIYFYTCSVRILEGDIDELYDWETDLLSDKWNAAKARKKLKALPNEIMLMTTNLPSGYHRDLQLLKEHLFPSFRTLKNCIEMAGLMLSNIEVKKDILQDEKYKYLFSVEEVNKLVLQGLPFRDAYKKVGLAIEENDFHYNTAVHHTHEGSIGNLCTKEIQGMMQKAVEGFNFGKVARALEQLLS